MKKAKHTVSMLGTALLAATLLGGAAQSSAESVQVPVGQQAEQKWTMKRPVTGMSQDQVEDFFGKPVNWREAVGDPPISSWIYEDFVVYFEYDRVLHTVLKPSGQPVASAE
ncbi:hypothetical protein ACXYTJ_06405 [Gilvimarinus sp. F26214L]|uniref:hypothetical protein n=1 Tax=Gilvimarinus sp. DZF01 TaxID=3461371 RepID=UPI0040466402